MNKLNRSHSQRKEETKVTKSYSLGMSSPLAARWFIWAATSGDVEKLKKIKEAIADDEEFRRRCDTESNNEGFRVLHIAALKGIIDMCTFLIKELGVDINIKTFRGDTPLLVATKNGQHDTSMYLIESGADIAISNSMGYTPLHWAVSHGNTKLLELLLKSGANIEADSVDGTPLHCAARLGNVESVKFLLRSKAKANSVSKLNGCSPLVTAIVVGKAKCVKLLLEAGADPNHKFCGLSPLVLAAEKHENCIKPLLENGADVNSLSWFGWKAIEHAAWRRNDKAVLILLPVTERISSYSKWSLKDLMNEIHSKKTTKKAIQTWNKRNALVKQLGDDALCKKEYSKAVEWYNQAIFLNPSNEILLANRSLCWERLGEGVFALSDAEECVEKKQYWAMSHFRVGCAWNVLKNYNMAMDAFQKAFDLDPKNEEIEKAYRLQWEYCQSC